MQSCESPCRGAATEGCESSESCGMGGSCSARSCAPVLFRLGGGSSSSDPKIRQGRVTLTLLQKQSGNQVFPGNSRWCRASAPRRPTSEGNLYTFRKTRLPLHVRMTCYMYHCIPRRRQSQGSWATRLPCGWWGRCSGTPAKRTICLHTLRETSRLACTTL